MNYSELSAKGLKMIFLSGALGSNLASLSQRDVGFGTFKTIFLNPIEKKDSSSDSGITMFTLKGPFQASINFPVPALVITCKHQKFVKLAKNCSFELHIKLSFLLKLSLIGSPACQLMQFLLFPKKIANVSFTKFKPFNGTICMLANKVSRFRT